MRVGLGLYRHMLTAENFRFARQAGATDIVAHLTDYFAEGPRIPDSRDGGWGYTAPKPIWSAEDLRSLRSTVEAEGLRLHALENLDPAFWYDVLLDGPERDAQVASVQQVIRNMGAAGIPVLGYNFSIAGVWGHVTGPWARGGAESVGFSAKDGATQTLIPRGQVWNMTYDLDAPVGPQALTSPEAIWDRLERFLRDVLPVAEASGVRLALHPDDPPLDELRGHARLVNRPEKYRQLLAISDSPSNGLEFCQGTIAEMTSDAGMSVYDAISEYGASGAIGYVHFRNVRGIVPEYHEVFLDEGDVDMARCLRLYRDAGYEGLLIPDHTPQMSCAGPWHAGMAYALGWMRAHLQALGALDV